MKRIRAIHAVWRSGNRVRLLENEEFFTRTFAAIASAQREVLIETFILFEDKVGRELHRLLVEAARRGVRVEITVDGYGSPSFSRPFLAELISAGVRFRVFDPHRRLFGMRLHVFRRMHRKLLVVDGTLAFVGGINFSADHLADFGPSAKQDYAVELEGPVVADIRSFTKAAIASQGTGESWRPTQEVPAGNAGNAAVSFVLRDNGRRADAIEHEYRRAIRRAQREVLIANAYFFPGWRFLHDLREAARRGVQVTMIFQGEPDMQVARSAARSLYRHLLDAGVRIHEYCTRPFHGKIALVDDAWATVGSSNLDPLSLSLNLEANVFIRDREFVDDLKQRMADLLQHHSRAIDAAEVPKSTFWQRLLRPLVFHAVRHFPEWAGWLPAHTPTITLLRPSPAAKAKRAP